MPMYPAQEPMMLYVTIVRVTTVNHLLAQFQVKIGRLL